MKTTFKKSLSMLLALMMIVALMLSATSCGGGGSDGVDAEAGRGDFIESLGGVSETFTGAVSVEEYESAEDAAVAFVAEEVVGESEAEIVKAESKGELSEAQVTALNIPEEFSEGIVSVEEYEVEYAVATIDDDSVAGNTQKVKVYIIKYENSWKYFAPAPITGETISKSYYDSVFNNEKYQNSTFEYKMDMEMDMSASAQGQSMKITVSMSMYQLVKYEDGKIYFKQTMTTSSNMAELIPTSSESIEAYVESVEGEYGEDIVCYINQGNGWVEGDLYSIGFGSLKELTPFYDQYIDYSYFTKTDFGFKLSDENAKKFVDEFYSDLLMGMAEAFELDMYAEYYVCDGTLSGMRMDMEMDIDYSEMGATVSGDATITATTTCTNYGTTVVEKPAGVN